MTEQATAFSEAWEQVERKPVVRDVSSLLLPSEGGGQLPPIAFGRVTKKRHLDLLTFARKAHQAWAANGGPAIKALEGDEDAFELHKSAQLIYETCKFEDGEDAFPGPQWVLGNFDAEEHGVLLALCQQARIHHHPESYKLDGDTVRGLRDELVSKFDSDAWDMVLAKFDRGFLASIILLMSRMWHDDVALLESALETHESD